MTDTTTTAPTPRNGVDLPTLFATLDAVKASPDIAAFQFRASNTWISGTHNRSSIQGSTAPGRRTPPALSRSSATPTTPRCWSTGKGPTPVEYLLHAVAACLTAGLANIAAARGVTLHRITSTVQGDIDLLGILGLSPDVRNGHRQIRVHFDVEGDASPQELAALVERSRRRSAVYDMLTNGTDVLIDVTTPA